MFDLTKKQYNILESIFNQSLKKGCVLVFGSRAMKTNTERSDIDIALKNSIFKSGYSVSEIIDVIDESDFPFLVDLLIYENLENKDLKKHIDKYGKILLNI